MDDAKTTDMTAGMSADEMMGLDAAMLRECVEACSTAARAATICADADTGDDMARCASMCANTADVATTMTRMMLRSAGYDAGSMRSMLSASLEMGAACADECAAHADMHEHCRRCAEACEAMVAACEKALGALDLV